MKKKRGLINSMGELSELPCWLRWKMNLARIIILKKTINKRKVLRWDLKRIQERVSSDHDGTYENCFCCEKQKNCRGWRRDSYGMKHFFFFFKF